MILDQLARAVHAGRVVALTGAGMSTESGIPDYRGPDGQRRVQPMTYGELLATPEARRRYWARAFVGWERFTAARPNAGHQVVAALQRHGYVDSVVTQNVDGLHTQAGSTDVLELHGTLSVVRCLTCEDRTSREQVQVRLAEANPGFGATSDEVRPDGDVALQDEAVAGFHLPRCLVCGSDLLKPDVVFFGEPVPRDRVDEAYRRVESADLLLVLGSSLKVMSGYRFVRRAHALGIPVGIVTRGRTRGDDEATWQLDAPLGEALTALAGRLGIDERFDPVVDGEYATGLPLGLV